ncbi:hypothetical protein RhiXN_08058 [Rhizoctonia solani]|uniref:DUF6534 domain-containing protein n=1 Tax=Rhizoctonia solani TaxID=456999 RepID=A0A8H8SZW9_9AGAM|nr:uncharacterized protein RhiXN_08058 [Rhizoctonia solani]QRW23022.1 hypothetical protein RhiXN_08058 [Rhizoctonia solani]
MGAPTLEELDKIAAPILSADKSLHLGPFIIAMGLDAVLAGVLFMQCSEYKALAMKDPRWIRLMVLYVLLMNVAITMYTWAWIYDLFVFNFGTYGLFLSVKYASLSWFYVLDSATVIVVQGFFAIRAWRLVNKNYLVLLVIGAFALTAFGGGIAVKVMFTGFGSTLRAGDVKIPAYIWLFCTVIADLTITVIILYFITRSRTGWSGTDNILSKLTRMTFESQLPPTLIAIGLAVEYTIKYDSFVAIPFICVQAKFYAISLNPRLNHNDLSRVNLKRGNTSSGENSSAQNGSRAGKSNQKNTNPYYLNSSRKGDTAIQVETTFDVVQDVNRSDVQVPSALQTNQVRRNSEDGLSLDSSSYKIPQDEEAKPGEYKLRDLGAGREDRTNSTVAWGERTV